MQSRLALISAIALVATTSALAEAPVERTSARLWEPRTKSVTVFKDGYGFFVRDGEVTPTDGWAVAGALPPAAFGTLAFFSRDDREIVDVVGAGPGQKVEFDGVDAGRQPAEKIPVLKRHLDLEMTLRYRHQGTPRESAGKLVSVTEEFALLESESGVSAVPVAAIESLQLLRLPLRLHVAREGRDATDKTTLGVAYLREGITWVPEYTLRLLDDKTAEMTLRGVVINQAEDLVRAEVNFVVGTPNFAHRAQISPLLAGQVLRMVAGYGGDPRAMSQIANSLTANFGRDGSLDIVNSPVGDDDGSQIRGMMGNLPRIESEGASDFSVYRIKELTVREGEKASVVLFTRRVPYGHLYKWTGGGPICHHLVLRNDSAEPWTTGPLIAMSNQQPLSEDLFKYVPAGGQGEFPLTEAVNITKKVTEVEGDRVLRAYQPNNHTSFDLVKLKGEIILRNFDKEEVRLQVSYPVQGKPTEATGDGKVQVGTEALQLTERRGTIDWDLRMKPGESITLGYSYERYVPSS